MRFWRPGPVTKRFFRELTGKLFSSSIAVRLLEIVTVRSPSRMTEYGMIAQAFQFASINRVQGDYLEFGLWQGRTFRYARQMKRLRQLHSMKMWGFDSFQGLPQVDDCAGNIWREGDFACTETDLKRILRAAGFAPYEYELVPGWYEHSLNDSVHDRLRGRSAAIVYIDCDLYESTIQVLRFLERYLVNGTIVCFDDYYCYRAAPDQGEQRALSQFLSCNQHLEFIPYFDYSPVGKSFIVRRCD